MGFFFNDADHVSQHKDFKKALKRADMSSKQQADFLGELEEVRKKHGSDRFREDHVKEAVRRLKEKTGDSLQGSQIERAARHITERLSPVPKEQPAKPAPVKEELKPRPSLRQETGGANQTAGTAPAEPEERPFSRPDKID